MIKKKLKQMQKGKMILCILFSFGFSLTGYSQSQISIPTDYTQLKRQCESLIAEKDNLMAQVKSLMEYKKEARDRIGEIDKIKADNDKLKTERDELLNKIKELGMISNSSSQESSIKVEEIDELKKNIENMKIEYRIVNETKKNLKDAQTENIRLRGEIVALNEKIKQGDIDRLGILTETKVYKQQAHDAYVRYNETLAEIKALQYKLREIPNLNKKLQTSENGKVDLKAEIGIYAQQARDFERRNKDLFAENEALQKRLEEIPNLNKKLQKNEDEKLNLQAKMIICERQVSDFRKKYNEALSKNKTLEKKLLEIPKKFAEVTRENKMLLKETALMHYNLGVFYTEKKEYNRAVAEFEKSIELNPDDGYAYFNLGYLYAEYLVNRPKAIESFRLFLKYATGDDKDVDWVKRYILTWQAWEGKTPLK